MTNSGWAVRGMTLEQRVEHYVARGEPSECWPWTGTIGSGGYGTFKMDGHQYTAHLAAHEVWLGPRPAGLVADHACHTLECEGGECEHRRCCNPAHLRWVSNVENVMAGQSAAARNARKDHCLHGHSFDRTKTTPAGNVGRKCRACERDRAGQGTRLASCELCGREMARWNLSRHVAARHFDEGRGGE